MSDRDNDRDDDRGCDRDRPRGRTRIASRRARGRGHWAATRLIAVAIWVLLPAGTAWAQPQPTAEPPQPGATAPAPTEAVEVAPNSAGTAAEAPEATPPEATPTPRGPAAPGPVPAADAAAAAQAGAEGGAAAADETPATEPEYSEAVPQVEGFRPAPEGSQENVSAPLMVSLAYGFIWLLTLLFLFSLWRRSRSLSEELAAADARLDSIDDRLARRLDSADD